MALEDISWVGEHKAWMNMGINRYTEVGEKFLDMPRLMFTTKVAFHRFDAPKYPTKVLNMLLKVLGYRVAFRR